MGQLTLRFKRLDTSGHRFGWLGLEFGLSGLIADSSESKRTDRKRHDANTDERSGTLSDGIAAILAFFVEARHSWVYAQKTTSEFSSTAEFVRRLQKLSSREFNRAEVTLLGFCESKKTPGSLIGVAGELIRVSNKSKASLNTALLGLPDISIWIDNVSHGDDLGSLAALYQCLTAAWAASPLPILGPENRRELPALQTTHGSAQSAKEIPAQLASCLQSFNAFIAERTHRFVPRNFIVKEIDRFFARERSGYFVIKGHPGMGKSALIAHLVATRKYIHHFNIAAESRNTPAHFLKNICAQLILNFDLPYSALPEDTDKDPDILLKLLEETGPLRRDGERLVIAVDALDEVDAVSCRVGNVLYLPTSLPDGVYIVATTRSLPTLDPRSHLVVSPSHALELNNEAEWHCQDIRTYVEAHCDRDDLRAWMDARRLGQKDFVELILQKSEGNFMYLRHVLPALGRTLESGDLVSAAITVEELPQGLVDYYKRHWTQMQVKDQDAFQHLYRPVLCVLAASRVPVPLGHLAKWTAIEPEYIHRVIETWKEFLYSERRSDGQLHYRIYHNSFRDFLSAEVDVGLRESQTKITRSGLRQYGRSKNNK